MVRFVAIIVVISLFIPIDASASVPETVQPCASAYLSSYNAYVYLPGDGEVRVYFNVQGDGYMDEIGALFIELYESEDGENWDWVDTFNHYSTSGMLSYVDNYHSSYVSYDGTKGNYYKAYVCVWAGEDGDGDSRYFWTSAKH
jgi:hypothetical protein